MAADCQISLCFFLRFNILSIVLLIMLTIVTHVLCITTCDCDHGTCKSNDTFCECNTGWAGPSCSYCSGRVRLSEQYGIVTDGKWNYSVNNKCIWLLEPVPSGRPLRLFLNQFATECGWDHLYIFDGDSIFSPLIAVLSGLLQSDIDTNNTITELEAKSGKAYLYFYSDVAYNMTGFNLYYSVGNCSHNCSGHGKCHNFTCKCDDNYMGQVCEVVKCPNNCSNKGVCNSTLGRCQCFAEFKGADCGTHVHEELWVRWNNINEPVGRASSASVIIDDVLYITGGYSFGQNVDFLITYNLTSHSWQTVKPNSKENPMLLYGHSLVNYKDCLYIFGGVFQQHIESRLWIYNITNNSWTYQNYTEHAIAGHIAEVVDNVMYIIFGHSPVYGYMSNVQEIDLDTSDRQLSFVETTGALVKGGYGHSSVYYNRTGEIFVYGGYIAGPTSNTYTLIDKLYAFHTATKYWKILASSGSPRYLHSAVLLGDLMLTFGGNTHNDTSVSHGAKCYSSDFMAYDPECNQWTHLSYKDVIPNSARYGHIAKAYTDNNGGSSMYIFGGFTGVMLSDILQYDPGDCEAYINKTSCLSTVAGHVCVWYNESCHERSSLILSGVTTYEQNIKCEPTKGDTEVCLKQTSCGSCLSTAYGCKWCSNNCTVNCTGTDKDVTPDNCTADVNKERCLANIKCQTCVLNDKCKWSAKHTCEYETSSAKPDCDMPCYLYNSCENCTQSNCMWCSSQQRCVETNAYVALFLYGQCQEWVTGAKNCAGTRCEDLNTCEDCKTNPSCGWCNDVSNTGIGKCVNGSAVGPVTFNATTGTFVTDSAVCPASTWHFINCPSCQCNGHSSCTNDSSVCDACQELTEGDHCDLCMNGYYGNPKNGGNCTACSCNGQADTCNQYTGVCFCRTRGVKGDNCNVCDMNNNYYGNPLNGGTCYYNLKTDYQFTFNLSKPDDKNYTGINFMNIPESNDKDLDFTLNCSGNASINITWKSNSRPFEEIKTKEYFCTFFRAKFEHKDYNFGSEDNVTFFVYVYNFETPFWLQISFSQFPKIDLVHFFVTFFSCFLSLLIIAAILYKIKHKYDSYRRRQRMMVEMEEMASRPFASAVLEIEKRFENSGTDKKDGNADFRKRKKLSNKPGQIALEPLINQKAAVLSLFIQLPCGDEDWTPAGISGLAVGSALVTFGHQRKQSVEFVKADKTKHHKKHNIFDMNI